MIRLSIRRPVAVAMTYSAVALLGLFAWQNIPLEMLPNTQLPRLTITARWQGASPETVEAFLTSPLEATINQIKGVEKIVSDSEENSTTIVVDFDREVDMDFVRLELSERLSALEEDLPEGVRGLYVRPYVPRDIQVQQTPFLMYAFTGPYTLEALQRHMDEVVIPEIVGIEGVATADANGGRERLLEIRVDAAKTRSIGLNPFAISRAIQELNLVREAGVVRTGDQEQTITIVNKAQNSQDVLDAIVATVNGTPVRVREIAEVSDTYEEARRLERINGNSAVTLLVTKERDTNTVRVAEAVKARLASIENLHPFGSELILQSDESEDIDEQLTDLRTRAGFSIVVIFVVLLVFLRSFRSAGLIFATIAFSVLISLNLIYFGGLTLNLLTLMGLAMGFGLIVDNSIVVLENVFRRWQRGEAPEVAAEEGAKEVVLPIIASTATTLIVFVPFVYLQGELRVFYVPLAIVVGLTLMASLFVAFTFIPALSVRWLARSKRSSSSLVLGAEGLKGDGGAEGFQETPTLEDMGTDAFNRPTLKMRLIAVWRWLTRPHPDGPIYVRFYREVVGFTLKYPAVAIVITVLAFGGSAYVFDKYVTRGTIWNGGGSGRTYISVRISLPRGSDLDRTNQLIDYFEQKVKLIPEVERFTATVTQDNGRMEIFFPDSLENTGIPPAIKEEMLAFSYQFTGAEVRVTGYGPSFYGGGSSPPTYSLTVKGYNFEQVRVIAEDLGRRIGAISRVQDVQTNASGRYNRDRAIEYLINIDRAKLSMHGLSVSDLSQQLSAVLRGRSTAPVRIGAEDVFYSVQLREAAYMDAVELRETIIQTGQGGGIRLGDVVTVTPREVQSTIHRENQQYERTVAYEFRGPNKLGDAYQDAVIAATDLPPGYTVEKAEGWRWNVEQKAQIYMVLIVSIVLVYMVTAALFESIRQPLAVLLTVPMALIGVFMIFFWARASFTREAYVGVIMMGGIVVNNAILLVDHINRVRKDHKELSLRDAVLRGTLERVRPILMTTATTVIGLLPLVLFAESANSTIWNALAFTLIGGLLSSTIFVLTTTPSLYYLFEKGPHERAEYRAAVLRGEIQHPAQPTEPDPSSRGGGTDPDPEPQPA